MICLSCKDGEAGWDLVEDGEIKAHYDGDIWDAHDQAVKEFGVCPFMKDACDAGCERPDYVKVRNAIRTDPFHGLPLGKASKPDED